ASRAAVTVGLRSDGYKREVLVSFEDEEVERVVSSMEAGNKV
ncbi:hypothetical protein A2U01_0095566, partial [Trifolium medium]|nr:hypothetical protein [Trifolium medium]